MSEHPRIEELRRRVQRDPASIAFAQLAEEYRRAGRYEEAVRVCRAGLERHPSYLSARVTLGRALIELHQYDEAQAELDYVLRSAPENLAAIRGLAEIHQRRGELPLALKQYQAALGIAKHDPELEESVHDLARQLGSEPDSSEEPAPVSSGPLEIPPIPSDGADLAAELGLAAAPVEGAHTAEPAAETVPAAALPAAEAPVRPPELEAAADEFTRALEALNALTIDVPAPPLIADTLDLQEPAPVHDEPPVPPETAEAFPPGGPEEMAAPVVPPPLPAEDAEAIQELEAWLGHIVAERLESSKRS